MKKIVIAADHAGYELKEQLKKQLDSYKIIDLGTNSTESVDYPDFGKAAADEVAGGRADLGIVICGSGIGISIAANRNPKVRAALCTNVEMAKLSRQHNDANVLALAARLVSVDENIAIAKAFLNTEFEGGRHQKRVDQLGHLA